MRFARGLRPSHPDKIDAATDARAHDMIGKRLKAHVDGRVALPEAVDLRPFMPPIFDQNKTNTCYAASGATAAHTTLAAAGTQLPFIPSPWVLSRVVRALERARDAGPGPLPPLTDDGGELADVVAAYARYGVEAMKAHFDPNVNYDASPANVNDELSLEELEEAGETLLAGPYNVDTTAPDATHVLCSTLASGITVLGAVDATPLEDLRPGEVATKGAKEPDHAIVVVGYQLVSGKIELLIANSWSEAWCDKGCGLLDPAAVREAWPAAVTRKAA